jgi:peptide/nickel transport system substrate-binding protein
MKTLLVLICSVVCSQQALTAGGGELRFALAADPKTLDPLQVTEDSADALRYLTTASLVRLDRQTLQEKPELAESWKITEGGKRITFKLRSGLKFSDGTPLDAEDVAYTLRRVLNPKTHLAAGDSLRTENGTPEVHVLNPQEVSLGFPKGVSALEAMFDTIPVLSSRSSLKDKAGAGPFLLAEYKPGSFLLLKRNPNYWKKDAQGRRLPYLDTVRMEIQQNHDIESIRFLRGELHLMIGTARGAVDAGPTFDSEVFWFNQVSSAPIPAYKKKWFQSQPFRTALAVAVRRDDIVKLVYHGRATAAAGPFSPSAKPWANTTLASPAYDPERATKLLSSAGFRRERDALKDSSGNRVEFSLITNAGNQNRARMASLLQQDLQRIGIKLNIVSLDMPSLIERITRTFQYEACQLGYLGTNLDPNDQLNIWLSSSSTHPWNPHQASPATPWEAEIDRLMREQSASANVKQRKALIDRFQVIVHEQAPMIYLVYPHALVAVSPKLNNALPSVLRPRVFWNAEHLSLSNGNLVARSQP